MAEKSSELNETSGVLSETDKAIISTVADNSGDEFNDKYTENISVSETDEGEAHETEQIRGQIEETRREMGETIDAIQEKLSIQNITEQVKDVVSEQVGNALETAKDSVYSAIIENIEKVGKFMKTAGRELSKSEAGKIAANNPFPLLLIGLGIGLLAYQGFGKKNRKKDFYDYDLDRQTRENSSRSLVKSAQSKIGDVAGNVYDNVSDVASSTYENVSGAASSAYENVSGAANSAYENVTNAAGNAYSSVNDYAHKGYEKVGDLGTQARESYDHYIEESPLAVGAVALALGAAVGLSIPSSRYEGELLGEYRQELLDKAQTAASGLVDRVKEVASEAQKTISEEVKTAVDETKKTICSEAERQGLTTDKNFSNTKF